MVFGTSSSVPLHEQSCSAQFRTHESKTSYPNAAIGARVKRALEVGKLAAPLIRKGMGTAEACQLVRDRLDGNAPLDVE